VVSLERERSALKRRFVEGRAFPAAVKSIPDALVLADWFEVNF